MKTKRFVSTGVAVASIAIAGLVLSGCSTGSKSSSGDQTDSGGKITVWVDPPRVPAADAFKKAHPEIPIDIVQIDGTVGGKTVQQQFAQFDAAGKGWPDAIFFPSNDDIAWAASPKSNYAADMSKLTPELVKGYDPAVLAMCDIGGTIRCLRNDAAPDVFWYNAKFFKDNGYTVPTTWEDYGKLGAQIAKEHPGMVSGFTGDAYAPDRYLWAADCPTNDTVDATTVHIDLADPKCQRAKDLLTTLYDGKALSTDRHLRRGCRQGRPEHGDEPRCGLVGRLPVPPDLEDPGRHHAGHGSAHLGRRVEAVDRRRGWRTLGHVLAHQGQGVGERRGVHEVRRQRPGMAG